MEEDDVPMDFFFFVFCFVDLYLPSRLPLWLEHQWAHGGRLLDPFSQSIPMRRDVVLEGFAR